MQDLYHQPYLQDQGTSSVILCVPYWYDQCNVSPGHLVLRSLKPTSPLHRPYILKLADVESRE